LVITREEFQSWLENPVTKALKGRIRKDIALMYELLVQSDLDAIKELQGRCKASQNLLDVEYEDLYE
jgi:hypothetical protein